MSKMNLGRLIIYLDRGDSLSSLKNHKLSVAERLTEYNQSPDITPLFIKGDALSVLQQLPDSSVDFCMTSPPYWGKRQYAEEGIGLEANYLDYIKYLTTIFLELKRVLKDTGSFWLNIGDSYKSKSLLGIPWRVAFELTDNQGWILRNEIIWNKVKGSPDNSKDKLGNVHEQIFHFVKKPKGYYYDTDSIRSKPSQTKVVNGAVVSATGVSGVRYKRQIELSTELTPQEKKNAMEALNNVLKEISEGSLSDFRMIIRGQQRTTHSDSKKVSGRAKELHNKGFYFLKYHPNGSKPRDVWDILPEDTQKRKKHFAAYPEDICKIPLLATCPENGIVIDPFSGTGTTMLVAKQLGRKSVGIELSAEYIEIAKERCGMTL
ncbi:DNA methyltransferase [Candidatus Thiomargarita nelsonii]|uniref:Methyltransferase n=1 Tax=Candidatus Thiomargarita nelsonii TaxID=1003181 RepID=A0A0A6P846_9GAMM|nr:DNA methyltransferase [Candidatus Thiomargarita nelsonii]